jgi:VanZ family protein
MVLFILYATLAPSRYVPDLHLWDKLEHATAFFGMTFWFGGLVRRSRFWVLALVMSVFGAAIEVAQGTMGLGRDMDIHDWIADSIGILLALGLLLSVPRRRGSWLRWFETLIGR